MAKTKRFRVAFDLKCVVPTDEFAEFEKGLVRMTKELTTGGKLNGAQKALVLAALNGGPEAALELAIKSGVAETLRQEVQQAGATVANIGLRVVR